MACDAEVEFEVLGGAQGLVESAQLLHHLPTQHHRCGNQGRIVQQPAQGPSVLADDVAATEHVDVPVVAVDAFDVADHHAELRPGIEEGDLQRGLLRHPFVVAVEQGQVAPAREPHAVVARRGYACVGLPYVTHAVAVAFAQHVAGVVGRAVVDHDDLLHGARLRQDGVDGARQQGPAVVRRYNH